MADVVLCPSFRTMIVLADPAPAGPFPAGAAVDFEFAASPLAVAVADAQIYPVFGRASKEGSPLVNPPSAEATKKIQKSTVATAKRCPVRELLARRYRSDRRPLCPPPPPISGSSSSAAAAAGRRREWKEAKDGEVYRRLYGGRAGRDGGKRGSSELYRKEVVGFLPSLNGIKRTFLAF